MTTIDRFVAAVKPRALPVAIVTGATGGVGAICARMLADMGYATVLLGRDTGKLATLRADLTRSRAAPPSCDHALDLRDASAISRLARGLASLTTLRLMILAAGVTNNHTTSFQEQDLQPVFDANVFGPMRLAKHIVPLMLQAKNPYLINIASRAGLMGFPDKGVYGASKAAAIRYFEALQAEHANTDLRVTSINPTWIDTPMAISGGCKRDLADILQPEDIADTIKWLISSNPRMLVRNVTIEIANAGSA